MAAAAFGFGGSNFHCVMEEYDSKKQVSDQDSDIDLLPFAAGSRAGLEAQVQSFSRKYRKRRRSTLFSDEARKNLSLSDQIRLAVLVESSCYESKLQEALSVLRGEVKTAEGIYLGSAEQSGPLAVVFAGQGAQYPDMMGQFMSSFEEAHDSLEVALDKNSPELFRRMYPGKAFSPEQKKQQVKSLAETNYAQPALGAVSAGLWKVLQSFGVQADMFAGHSFGELGALYAAGVYDEETYHKLAHIRGRLMASASGDLGGMMAVLSDIQKVESFLKEHDLKLVVANHNAPEQVVVAGSHDELARAKSLAKKSAFARRFKCGGSLP